MNSSGKEIAETNSLHNRHKKIMEKLNSELSGLKTEVSKKFDSFESIKKEISEEMKKLRKPVTIEENTAVQKIKSLEARNDILAEKVKHLTELYTQSQQYKPDVLHNNAKKPNFNNLTLDKSLSTPNLRKLNNIYDKDSSLAINSTKYLKHHTSSSQLTHREFSFNEGTTQYEKQLHKMKQVQQHLQQEIDLKNNESAQQQQLVDDLQTEVKKWKDISLLTLPLVEMLSHVNAINGTNPDAEAPSSPSTVLLNSTPTNPLVQISASQSASEASHIYHSGAPPTDGKSSIIPSFPVEFPNENSHSPHHMIQSLDNSGPYPSNFTSFSTNMEPEANSALYSKQPLSHTNNSQNVNSSQLSSSNNHPSLINSQQLKAEINHSSSIFSSETISINLVEQKKPKEGLFVFIRLFH